MRFRLPTSHFIYFGLQVKKGKLDSAGKTKTRNENITEALNQIRMALQNPVLDTEVNRKVLIDHVYLIASGDITKAARELEAGALPHTWWLPEVRREHAERTYSPCSRSKGTGLA